ncbi:MAG: hypothetical protein WDN06_15815 [Asticcacaulis sp.]
MAATTATRFQPTIHSFGELTLRPARMRRLPSFAGINLSRHYPLLLGWAFTAVFLAGLGSLYALDSAAFAQHDRPVIYYGGVALDND